MKIKDVTFAVSTLNNFEALNLCISSVLNGSDLPAAIMIRSEGDLPSFSFYTAQLASLAKIRGVAFTVHVEQSYGIRHTRDWMLHNCKTRFLWMGDDDVVYDYDALHILYDSYRAHEPLIGCGGVVYVCGNKRDVNNRRGYGDFSTKVITAPLFDDCPTYLFYDKNTYRGLTATNVALDTGFALFNVELITGTDLRFSLFNRSYNSGGEDNLFGLMCRKWGFSAYFAPSAQAYHLEKQQLNFSESAARAEMIVRSAEAAEIADGKTEYQVFPWLTSTERKEMHASKKEKA